jgi:hypothetical protein
MKNASKFMSANKKYELEFLLGATTTNNRFDIQLRGDTEPMQGRTHIFDNTMGVAADSWLDKRQLRRELTDNLNRESINARAESAQDVAQGFLDDLNRKAQLRDGISRKSEELKRLQQERIRREAEEYRQRLRRRMPRSLRDPDRD